MRTKEKWLHVGHVIIPPEGTWRESTSFPCFAWERNPRTLRVLQAETLAVQDVMAIQRRKAWHGSKMGQVPLCEAPCGPSRQRYLTPF